MQKSVKFNFLDFVKKFDKNFWTCHLQSNIGADSKMSLKIAVTESYKHNSKKAMCTVTKNSKIEVFSKLEFGKSKSSNKGSIKTL